MEKRTSTASDERVTIEIADGVAEVTLNRPDKLNALDPAMFEAIIAAGEQLSRTAAVRAVVLLGAGKGFCAGLDMQSFAAMAQGNAGQKFGDIVERTHGIANAWQQAAYVWRTLPAPVIAAIHGVAFGGGFQIALGADVRYVAPDARLAIMEIKWGIVPDMSGIALMRELARSDVIRELTITRAHFLWRRCAQLMVSPPACTPTRSPPPARPPSRSPRATRRRYAPSSASSTQQAITTPRRSFSPNRKSRRR